MITCGCGYMGVNLVPNKEDNTARCPGCNTVFYKISADQALYDDFSKVVIGDQLKRVYGRTAWDATVTDVTETEIVCEFIADCPRTCRFDRVTGIDMLGVEFGFITFEFD